MIETTIFLVICGCIFAAWGPRVLLAAIVIPPVVWFIFLLSLEARQATIADPYAAFGTPVPKGAKQ